MITVDGNSLTIDQLVAVARDYEPVQLAESARIQIERSREWIESILHSPKPVYGINTGFGIFAEVRISNQDTEKLNRNLIISHAVATGPPLSEEIVRAAMLIRANTLAKGYSGVRQEIIGTIIEMLNKGVVPEIPSQGSLGSSGDLAPLSHLALVFTTDKNDREDESGWASYHGKRLSGKKAMAQAGIPRLILQAKEGLAVNNGATFSAAIAALAVHDGKNLLESAEIALAMSLEAMVGVSAAFDPRIHQVRNHPGQMMLAKRVLQLLRNSTLIDSGPQVQDAYSLRCAPQVQGAAEDAIEFIHQLITREINAATDNPLIFGPGEAISGGNFHGEPIGMVMDFLSVALTEVAGISERRIFRLTDHHLSMGLPSMLVDKEEDAGLNSGMMMPQYTAASLVLESQTLSSPDSVYSLPTSAEKEDHNANSMTAARNARQIVINTAHVLAIEVYCAARGIDLRLRSLENGHLGDGVQVAYDLVRKEVPYQAGDAFWYPEIERVRKLVTSGRIKEHVNRHIDELY